MRIFRNISGPAEVFCKSSTGGCRKVGFGICHYRIVLRVKIVADTDVARKVATLARASLRTQSSAVMHTQANVLAEAALRVLVG
jgi:hypothetical protein